MRRRTALPILLAAAIAAAPVPTRGNEAEFMESWAQLDGLDFVGCLVVAYEAARTAPQSAAGIFSKGYLALVAAFKDSLEQPAPPAGVQEEFDEALAVDPGFWPAHYGKAMVLSLGKRHRAAVAELDLVIKQRPDYAPAYVSRANDLDDLGDPEAALRDYASAIKLNPEDPRAYRNRAVVYYKLGRLDDAVEENGIAVTIFPDYAFAYKSCAETLLKLNRLGEALWCFRHVARLDGSPGTKAAYEQLEAEAAGEGIKPQRPAWPRAARFARTRPPVAVRALVARSPQEKLKEANRNLSIARALGNADMVAQASAMRGMVLDWLGRGSEADTAYLAAGRKIDCDVFRAMAASLRGDFPGSIEICNRVLGRSPSDEAFFIRGRARLCSGDFAGAENDAATLLAKDPRDFGSHFTRGCALWRLGRCKEAEAALSRSLEYCDPQYERSWTLLLRAAFRDSLGNREGAIGDCGEALAIRSDFAEALLLRAQLRGEAGRASEAALDREKARGLRPDPMVAGNPFIGKVLNRAAQQEPGPCDAGASPRPAPSPAPSADPAALYSAGDIDGAWRAAYETLRARPANAAAWQIIGNCQHAKGDKAGALVSWKRALELDPANTALRDWIARVERTP